MVRTELNRVTAMLLSVLMILSSFSIVTTLQAEAETVKEQTTIHLLDTDIKWAKTVSFEEPYSTKTWTFYQGQKRKNLRTAEGKVAYCVQPGTWMWDFVNNRAPELSTSNASVWNSLKQSDKIGAVKLALYFGYPNNNITAIYGNRFGTLKGTAAEREVATQLVLWEFILGYRDPISFTLDDSRFVHGMFGENYSTNPQNAGVYEAYKQIVQAINHWKDVPSFSKRNARLADTQTMKWNGSEYTVTLQDTTQSLNRYSLSCDDKNVSFKVSGNTLTVSSKQPINNTVKVDVTTSTKVSDTTNNVVAYGHTNKDMQEVIDAVTADKPDPVRAYFNLKTESQGILEVTKNFVSEDGTILNGNIETETLNNTKFKIRNSVGKFITATKNGAVYTYSDANAAGTEFTLTKDSNTNAIYFQVTKLPVGTYAVIEQDTNGTGFQVSGSKNVSVSIQPGQGSSVSFENQSSQLTIDKTFFQYGKVTDDDYKNTAFQIQQGNGGYIRAKLIDEENNIYQYQYGASNSNSPVLTFANPKVHSITVLGLPIKNGSSYYTYTVSEIDKGQVTGNPISHRYTYNTVKKTFQSGIDQSASITNTEKNEGYIEIEKAFRVEKADGTTQTFTGEDGLTIAEAYNDIYFCVKNASGLYIAATKENDGNYAYTKAVSSIGQATHFEISASDSDHKIEVSNLPYGVYYVTEVVGSKVKAHGFNVTGLDTRFLTTSYDVKADEPVGTRAYFSNVKQQVTGLKIYKNFTNESGEGISVADDLYKQMTFKIENVLFVQDNAARGTYHVYNGKTDSGKTPITEMRLGTESHAIVVYGLATGKQYTVTETITGDNLKAAYFCDSSYTVEGTTINGTAEAESQTVQKAVVTLPNGNESTASVYFNNKLKTKDITIYKDSEDDLVERTFEVSAVNYDGFTPIRVKTVQTVVDGNRRGVATVSNLPYVYYDEDTKKVVSIKYNIEEVDIPLCYETTEAKSIIPNNSTSVTFTNKLKKGKIEVVKKAEVNGSDEIIPLDGIEFELTNDYNDTVITDTTDENGKLTFDNLPVAYLDGRSVKKIHYTVTEKATAKNEKYVLSEAQTVAISYTAEEAKRIRTLEFVNTPITGNVVLEKADEKTKELLSGAVFTVYKDVNGNGKLDANIDTLATGYITSEGSDGKTVYTACSTLVEVMETVADEEGSLTERGTGRYELFNLEKGKYIVKETKAPTGYVMSKTVFAFEIAADNQTVQLYEEGGKPVIGNGTQTGKFVYNTPIYGRLYLEKVDEDTKELLSGATFRVFKDTDGNGKLDKKTDESIGDMAEIKDAQGKGTGTYEMNDLPYGTYFVYESVPPKGYVRDKGIYKRNISQNGATVKVGSFKGESGKVGNTKIKGNVTVIKLSPADPENPTEEIRLDGAVFTIYKDVNSDGAITPNKDTVYKIMEYDAANQIYYLNDLPYGDYVIEETTPPVGHVKTDKVYPFSILDDGLTVPITDDDSTGIINQWIEGKVQLTKRDSDTKDSIEGATFTLFDENGKKVESKKTNSKGELTFSKVIYGNYTVKETEAPEGYLIDEGTYPVSIKTQGQTITVSNTADGKYFEERKFKGTVKLTKRNSKTTEPIEGAEFTLYDANGSVVKTAKTNNLGRLTFSNIPYGKYTIKETKAPTGFVLDEKTYELSIKSDGQTVNVTNDTDGKYFIETPIEGIVSVYKVDGESNTPLAGAEFSLYDPDDYSSAIEAGEEPTPLMTAITNKEGRASFTEVPYGDYIAKETVAPKGYVIDKGVYEINIRNHSETIYVENTTDGSHRFTEKKIKGNIQIKKIDTTTGEVKPISGAEFTLYDSNGKFVQKQTTGENGKATFQNVPYGKYTVIETNAPDGYMLDDTAIPFDIVENGVTLAFEHVNVPESGKGYIRKVSEDGVVADVKFHIYGTANNGVRVDTTATTDASGIIPLDFYEGTYTVEEVNTPIRYLPQEPKTVTIENGKTKVVKFRNVLKKGSVVVQKYNAQHPDEKVSGAEFTVYQQGNEIGKLTETSEGVYELNDIPYGTYTLKETSAPEGFIRDKEGHIFTIKNDGETVKITNRDKDVFVEDQIEGTIELIKINETTRIPLKGAEFTLYNAKGQEVQKLTTGKDGKVTFTNVRYGKYTVVETKAPDNYEIDSTPIPFNVVKHGVLIAYEAENTEIPGYGFIKKTSEDGVVEGFKFKVTGTSKSGVEVNTTVTTDAKGEFNLELYEGTYTVEEVSTPARYIKPEKQQVEIKSGKTSTVRFTNNLKKGTIIIRKYNEKKPDELVSGAEFTVYQQGEEVGKLTETSKGVYELKDVAYGSYTVRETKAPEGYVLNRQSYIVRITENSQIAQIANNDSEDKFLETPIEGGIKLTKKDSKTSEPIQGAEFTVYNEKKEPVRTGTTDKNGNLTFSNIPYGTYTIKETKAPKGYNIDPKSYPFSIETHKKVITITNSTDGSFVEKIIEGSISIYKINGKTKKALAGAEFTLYDANNEEVQTLTTGKDGTVIFSEVPYGKYTIQETKAPEGYLLDEGIYDLEIKTEGQNEVIANTTDKKFMNTQIEGSVELTKRDDKTHKPLEGAVFTLYDSNGKVVERQTTNSDGKLSFKNVVYGTYTIKETKAPEGYLKDNGVYSLSITENGQVYTVSNTPDGKNFDETQITGSVKLTKKDSENDEPLKGAEFTLYDAAGTPVQTLTTDENGKLRFTEVPYGSYTVKETKAPTGYLIDTDSYPLNIKTNGQVIVIRNKQEDGTFRENPIKGNVKLTKKDSETDEPLEGAEFTLYDKSGKVVETLVTNAEGKLTFANVRYGKYTVKETKAPRGYLIDTETYTLSIENNGETITIANRADGTFREDKIKGGIKVVKIDKDKQTPLAGAEFTLYDESGTEVKKLTTGITGEVNFTNIPFGKYTVVETKAPDNYEADTTPIPFEILENGKTLTHTHDNTEIPGYGFIKKVSEDDVVTGFKFHVTGTSDTGTVVDETVTTDEKGEFNLALLEGTYTVEEVDTPNRYVQPKKQEVKIKSGETTTINFENKLIRGNIEILKVDKDKQTPLSGAEFTLYDEGNGVVQQLTTGTDGKVAFNGIPYGKYTVVETKAPNNYEADTTPIPFEILENGKTITHTQTNTEIPGYGFIKKTSEDGIVEGLKFRVTGTSNTGTVVDETVVTDAKGEFNLKLLEGIYTVEEIETPDRYIGQAAKSVEIKSGKTSTVSFENRLIRGSIEVLKVDKDKQTPLSGAEFTLYNSNGETVMKLTTDAEGKVTFNNIPYGSYTVVETKAPNNYKADTTPIPFEILENGKTLKHTHVNTEIHGHGFIKKVSEDDVVTGFKFHVTGTSDTGTVVDETVTTDEKGEFNLELLEGTYTVEEVDTPNRYVQPKKQEVKIKSGETTTINFENKLIRGNIEVLKVDKDKKTPLSGAEFTLYNSNGETVMKLTTGENGKVTFSSISYGKYTVVETKAPNNYEADTTPIPFEILENGKTLTHTHDNNEIPGYGFIKKTSEDGVVEGLKFRVTGTSNTGTVVDTVITTNSNGEFKLRLLAGTYTVEEIETPDRYIQPEKQEVKVESGKTSTVSFENKLKKGSIIIRKYNAKYPEEVVSGAEFTVYQNNAEYGKLTEISKGIYELKEIPYGSYTVKETKAPEGYVADTETYNFNISKNNQSITITNENTEMFSEYPIEGSVQLVKKDSKTNEPIEGAEFTLYNADGKAVQTKTTNKEGKLTFSEVRYGEYTVKETKAPDNYLIDKGTYSVNIKNHHEVITVANSTDGTFWESPIEGSIMIIKVDDKTQIPLAGAEFTLYNVKNEVVQTVTTGEDGTATFGEVKRGSYTVVETKAPPKYKADSTPIPFEVLENGKTLTYTKLNTEIPGYGHIKKTSEDGVVEGFKFHVTGTSDSGVAVDETITTDEKGEFNLALLEGTYTVEEIETSDRYVQPKKQEVQIKSGKTTDISFENKLKKGSIIIYKYDSTNPDETVSGAVFTVYQGNAEYGKLTETSKGIYELKNIPYGSYTVIETKAPEGYVPDRGSYDFTISENRQLITITNSDSHKFLETPIEGSVQLVKKDSKTNEPIEGAEFTLYNADGKVVQTLTTDKEGKLTFKNIRYGEYTVKETKAPDNYLIDTGTYPVSIKTNGKVITVQNREDGTFVEQPIEGGIKLIKKDSKTNEPIAGAEFTLYDSEGKAFRTKTTDKNGVLVFSDIPYGSYTVKETKAPEQYLIDEGTYHVTIENSGEVVTIQNKEDGTFIETPIEGNIRLVKRDSKTDEPIEGAEFTLYDAEGNAVKTLKTDVHGKLTFKDIRYGEYTVKETKAPDNYLIDKGAYPVIIENNGETITVQNKADGTFVETPIEGSVQLVKKDSKTNEPIEGAEFTLYNSDGEVVQVLTTDKEGKLTFKNIRYGEYTVKETKAPDNYLIDTGTYPVSIKTNGKVITVQNREDGTFVEQPIEGGIKLTKKDSENNEPIAGAEFTLYDSEGKAFRTKTTDKNGVLVFSDIPYGSYTVKETKAPEQYLIDEGTYHVTIENSGEVVTIQNKEDGTFVETPIKGTVRLVKRDSKTDEPIEGAEFTLYDAEGNAVKTLKTDVHGKLAFRDLRYGEYTVKETKAPDNYIMDEGSYPVSIKTNGETITVQNSINGTFIEHPIEGSIQVVKVDKNTRIPLSGAEFTLYNSNGDAVQVLTTGEDGIVTFSEVPYGKYTVIETKAPAKYKADPTPIPFEILENSKVIPYTKTNEEIPGYGFIKKTSEDDVVAGFKFHVTGTSDSGVRVDEVVTTDEKGEFNLALYEGTYTVEEVETPDRYVQPAIQEVKVESGKTSTVTFINNIKRGSVIIRKYNKNKPDVKVSGAEFTVYQNNAEYGKLTETSNGIYELKNIPFGSYTVKETYAPNNYIIDNGTYDFSITEDGQIVTVSNSSSDRFIEDEHIPFELTKKDISTGELIPNCGFRIKNSDGEIVVEGYTDENGIATFKLLVGSYTYQEFDAPDGYIINEDEHPFTINPDDTIVKAEMTNIGTGSFEMTKTDIATGEPIPNTAFKIRNSEGKVIRKGRTDENGVAKFEKLPYGKYTYQEYDAPDGYIIDEAEYPFEIKVNGEVVKAEMKNTGTGTLEMTKTDIATGEPIPNTAFKIRNSEGKVIRKGRTDENGVAKFEKLPYGKYTYQEYDAPDGYIIDEAEYPFEIKVNGEVVKAEMKNTGTGTLEMTKTDIATGEPIPNTSFRIRNSDGEIVREGKTDENGVARFEALPYGKYTYQEYDAPDGYIIDEAEYPFEIKVNGEVVKAEMKNTGTGTLEMTKTDIATGEPIPNTSFRIRNSDGEIVREGKTDENGVARFEALPYGKYTYQEYDAPDGYIIDESEYPFEIKVNGEVVKAEMKNTGTGTLEMTKTDIATGEPIPNTSFRIRNSDGEIVREGKTDENGIARFEALPYGKYTYQEYDAPDGYIIDESEYPFEIKVNGEVVKAEMKNTGTGTLEMTKTDIATGEPIPNTSFRIRNSDGEIVREGKTDENGIARFEALPYGKYTYQEYDAPDGYIIDEAEYPFEIKVNGEVVKAEMKNTGTGTLELTKKDVADGELIPNCGVEILDRNKKVIFQGRTDKDGLVKFGHLPYGTYYYREFDAPEGYILDETPHPFEIKKNGEIVKAVMTNKKKQKEPGYITTDDKPKTGDTTGFIVVMLMLVAGISVLLIVFNVRHKKSGKKSKN